MTISSSKDEAPTVLATPAFERFTSPPASAPPAPYPVTTGASEIESYPAQLGDVEAASSLVDITAPTTMAGGYTFDAQYDGKIFQVVVPPGGVEKGQTISVPAPSDSVEKKAAKVNDTPQIKGKFKDNLCEFCIHGCCHPTCCIPFWAPFCAMGQLMTRLKLTWLADPGSPEQVKKTFTILVVVGVVHWVIYQFYGSATRLGPILTIPLIVLAIYLILISTKTRALLRIRDEIPADTCCEPFTQCEDFWINCCCSCCSISQMMRHTGDYENGNEDWCSPTGLRKK